ncbi:MAG: ATP-binding protein [Rhabdochlamydiaceae bacterium]|nr:ATP-binding protein [Rhabdochlamydiaceae bacterium]
MSAQNHSFVGRQAEMARLEGLLSKRSASLVVVRGRRRIGKSRLLKEFGKKIKSFFFSGLPPKGKTRVTAKAQKKEFVSQLEQQGIPGVSPDDWSNLFWHLAQYTKEGRVLVVLDEISWMGSKDADFLGKLKNAWDLHFSNNPQLILVLCGSISSWIEKNILSSTGYLGRVSIDMVLEELPLKECNAFWHPNENRISPYEKFKVLSVTGGVPLYLEQVHPELSAEENIRDLCFTRGGLLVREFEQIFSDLFSKRSNSYKAIVECLSTGPKELSEIVLELKKSKGGTHSEYIDNLVQAGYVKRDFTWHLKTGKGGKISRYRLSDNYLRFYLKYIAPNQMQIDNGLFAYPTLPSLPAWESMMGLQFENLVVHNRASLWKMLGIAPSDIIMDGPFIQTHTKTRAGCQIDYLIQTRFNTLYLCEIKFYKRAIGIRVVEEVEKKREILEIPKHCSIRPILIHVNGVEEGVLESRCFDKIIDFGDLLR